MSVCARAISSCAATRGDQLARGERLDQIVVGAGLEPFGGRVFAGARRQEDHRHRRQLRFAPQLLHQGEPVELGHHHVADDEIGTAPPRGREGGCAVAHRFDGPALGQKARYVLAQIGVVVGDEDVCAPLAGVAARRRAAGGGRLGSATVAG